MSAAVCASSFWNRSLIVIVGITAVCPSLVRGQELLVTSYAGASGVSGDADAVGVNARFRAPYDIAVADDGTAYVADYSNHTIRAITPAGSVSTVAGLSGVTGRSNGMGSSARFFGPVGVTVDRGGTLYVSELGNRSIRRIDPSGLVTTVAVNLTAPRGLAMGSNGVLYVSDQTAIRAIAPDGAVTTLAGTTSAAGSVDGSGAAARFTFISDIAIDAAGTLYVADLSDHTVRRVTPSGVVTTVAGARGVPGHADGIGSSAQFAFPNSLAFGPDGALFVADFHTNVIRRLTKDGHVTTVAGRPGVSGASDGIGRDATFLRPAGVAVDSLGVLHVVESAQQTVRRAVPVVRVGAGAAVPASVRVGGAAVDLTFTAVSAAGAVSVMATQSDAALLAPAPAGLTFLPNLTFEIASTMVFSRVEVCLPYQPGQVAGAGLVESSLQLLHKPQGSAAWVLVATSVDTVAHRACGMVDNLSPFALAGTLAPRLTTYLAEGATSVFFDTQLAILNPGDIATTATLRFLPGSGGSIVQTVPIPAKTRVTLSVKDVPGLATAEFSTTIDADQPLVVDRTMTWDGSGYGAHAETAVAAPATTWYLAEGATHSGFSLFYLLQNPSTSATTVRVRYLRGVGAPLEKTYQLAPQSRTNIWVNLEEFPGLGQALASADVSAVIASLDATPIIVERAMYRSNQGTPFNAGHESMGVTSPSTTWFLAEGATGEYFDEFVLIANPTDTDAAVTVTYLLGDGTTYSRDLVAPANARSGIWVDREAFEGVPGFPLADAAVSTTIESTNGVPLVVERAMWWPGNGDTWHEAHNSAGASTTGTRWALAEGEVGGPRAIETYILIANTSTYAGSADVTLLFEDGTSQTRTYPLAPRSRTNVAVADDFGAVVQGRRFGATVVSTGATPAQIVVERAMYSSTPNVTWAAGTNALATKLQ